jgi:predicted membrane-bound spermidine synthase
MTAFLHVLFLVSGAAGLAYELVWSRYLALFVGHAAYAQVLVIGIYLGGMALGSLLVGARARRLRHPLLLYAGAEYLLAVLGVGFPWLYESATTLAYEVVFPATTGSVALTVAKWGLATLLILPQSVLLGATFPLMTGAAVRRAPARGAGSVATFYFVNALGGAIGVLLAGFVLVARFGLPGTAGIAAVLNLAAGLGAWAVWRRTGPVESADGELAGREERAPAVAPARRLLLGVAFGTAVASFAYEIGWIRLLSLVMGSATHAFELMLSAFILGLALGSLAVRRRAERDPSPGRLLGWVQWWMGFAALATLPLYIFSFDLMAGLIDWLQAGGSYPWFNVARYGLGLLVMLPSTFLAGMTLPLITAALFRSGAGEGAIGAAYGANTLGSIVGVAAAGLVLLPALGLKGLLVAGAVLDMGLGVLLLRARPGTARWSPSAAVLGAATVAVALLALFGLHLDRALLTSGVFRYGELRTDRPILFYEDGRTATVSAHVTGADSLVVLSTNGKPDASLTRRWIEGDGEPEPIYQQDEATQSLTALIALAHVRDARNAAVIGHGSGITTHFLLGVEALAEVTTVEIEPEMYTGSRVYLPANRRAFEDPRSHRVVADAKSYFAQSGQRYDLIVSEPSNPWVSGTATLFTREFYDAIQRYLAPGGVFAQWIHLYEIEDELVTSVLAAVHAAFPDYRVFATANTDLLVVASTATLPEPDWGVFDEPGVRASLAHVPEISEPYLSAMRLVDGATLAPLLDRWPEPNSDLYPVLDLGAERARLMGGYARGFHGLVTDRFSFGPLLEGRRQSLPDATPAPTTTVARIRSLGIAAALRQREADSGDGADQPTPGYAIAREQVAAFRAVLAGDPPGDWRALVDHVMDIDRLLHGVPLTPVDGGFYAEVEAALDRWDAPAGPRAGVAYLRALGDGDPDEALRLALRLLDLAHLQETWVEPRVLLEGGVASAIRVGDPAAARRLLRRTAPLTGWPDHDSRLLWMRAAVARLGDPFSPVSRSWVGR